MSRSPSNPGHDQASPPTPRAAPSLRLRYAAPSEPEQAAIENVLAEAGELSHGINAMLHRAAQSTVGTSPHASAARDDATANHQHDDPMMAMFDEQEPSDIREMDRQLASEAEAAMASAIAPSEHADDHHADEPQISLEGEFESVEGLLVGMSAASPVASANAASNVLETPIAMTQAAGLANASAAHAAAAVAEPSAFQTSPAAASIVAGEPIPTVDLSLAPTQAAGIAAALAAASAAANATASRATSVSDVPPAFAPLAGVSIPSAADAIAPQTAAPQAVPTPVSVASLPTAPRRRHASGGTSIGRSIAQMIAITNLPLRLVPASMRPAINMLALSLALWAPAVWAIAPMMAARHAVHSLPDVDMPVHAESSLESGKDHAAPKAEVSHGGSESDHGAKATKAGNDRPSARKGGRASASKKSGDSKSAASPH